MEISKAHLHSFLANINDPSFVLYGVLLSILLIAATAVYVAVRTPSTIHVVLKKSGPIKATPLELLKGDELFIERIASRADGRAVTCDMVRMCPALRRPNDVVVTFNGPYPNFSFVWPTVSSQEFITKALKRLADCGWTNITLSDNGHISATPPAVPAPYLARAA